MANGIYGWTPTTNSTTPVDTDAGIDVHENCDMSELNNGIRGVMARGAQYIDDIGGVDTVGGTANAITITSASSAASLGAFTSYVAGMRFAFKAGSDNTGAATLNVDSVGAEPIRKITGAGEVELAAGDIVADGIAEVIWDAAADSGGGAWILTSRLPKEGSASVASTTTTDLSAIAEETITVTGTTTITGLGTAAAGVRKTLVFGGSLTFTHNGASLILPGSVNITTSAGDIAHMVSLGSGNWRCTNYTRGYVPPLLDRIVRAVADNAGNVVDARGVGSVTDDGTGLITFSLSENFGSANYALTATADDGTTTGQIRAVMITGKTTSAFALKCVNSSNALTDPSEYNAIAIGA